MNKSILVTGCAGFIGSHVCEALLNRGDSVFGIDNFDPYYSEAIKRNNLSHFQNKPNFKFAETSIINYKSLELLFNDNNFSHIVHLAAKAGVRPSIQKPIDYQNTNMLGTNNLLELSQLHGIQNFIFASSSSVYGNNIKVPFSETDNVDTPISMYAATKKGGELLCHTYYHLYRMNISMLRFFTVYGPRQRPEMAIHKFTRMIDEGRPIDVYGFGKPERDYTYIDDIVQGVVLSIDHVDGYEIYNFGESQTISTSDLIKLIEDSLGKKAIINEMAMQPGDVLKTYADIRKAKEKLGYNPITKIRDGIPKFVDWYVKNRELLLVD